MGKKFGSGHLGQDMTIVTIQINFTLNWKFVSNPAHPFWYLNVKLSNGFILDGLKYNIIEVEMNHEIPITLG